ADGTATAADGDYQPVHGLLLTFTPGGPLRQTVTVFVNGDTTVEGDETFTLQPTNASGATIGTARAGTSRNDDGALFSINDVTLPEGDHGTTPFTFAVTLSNPSSFPESVQVDTADGTATAADGDYQLVQGLILTFNPGGPLTQTVTVPVNGDSKVELDES